MKKHKVKARVRFSLLNTSCFIIGMIGLWIITHNWWVILFGWIASLHFTVTTLKGKTINL